MLAGKNEVVYSFCTDAVILCPLMKDDFKNNEDAATSI